MVLRAKVRLCFGSNRDINGKFTLLLRRCAHQRLGVSASDVTKQSKDELNHSLLSLISCVACHRKMAEKLQLRLNFEVHLKGKGRAVPLQAWSGPEGSRRLRFLDFMTTAQDGVKVVSLTHWPPLPPRKYTWYSFLLEAESTPGP